MLSPSELGARLHLRPANEMSANCQATSTNMSHHASVADKRFGHVPGQPVGTVYADRRALADAGVHPPLMQGIHGTARAGADSIVVSGGYVDDEDHGDLIIYTGAGGNDPATKRQVKDQSVDHPNNAGLVTSKLAGLPIRVTRGAHRGSLHAPTSGYRYEGLFTVTSHWLDVGRDGFKIVRYRLERLVHDDPASGSAGASDTATYATTMVIRRIRDSAQARAVKAWHDNACQVCGVRILIDGERYYSEGAHIRPLGRPHVGPDHVSNLLCLCPNHHAQLDHGGLVIEPDLMVRTRTADPSQSTVIGRLRTHPRHLIDAAHLDYLREHVFVSS